MASASLVARDEINDFIEEATVDLRKEDQLNQIRKKLLPVERAGVRGSSLRLEEVDSELAAEFKVIDADLVLSKMRYRRGKVPVPYFAKYDVFGNEDGFQVTYRRGRDGYNGVYGYVLSGAVQGNMLTKLQAHEDTMHVRAVVLAAAVGAVLAAAITIWCGLPWWVILGVSFLLGAFLGGLVAAAPFDDSDIVLQTRFAGFIPEEIREKIQQVRPRFSELYLIQEVDAKSWSQTSIPKPAPIDPLLIGVKNRIHYLIDRFDTTTMEEYMAQEFAV